jgi:hypothetical protein
LLWGAQNSRWQFGQKFGPSVFLTCSIFPEQCGQE